MDNSKNEDFLNENNDLSKVSELNNSNINLTKELEKKDLSDEIVENVSQQIFNQDSNKDDDFKNFHDQQISELDLGLLDNKDNELPVKHLETIANAVANNDIYDEHLSSLDDLNMKSDLIIDDQNKQTSQPQPIVQPTSTQDQTTQQPLIHNQNTQQSQQQTVAQQTQPQFTQEQQTSQPVQQQSVQQQPVIQEVKQPSVQTQEIKQQEVLQTVAQQQENKSINTQETVAQSTVVQQPNKQETSVQDTMVQQNNIQESMPQSPETQVQQTETKQEETKQVEIQNTVNNQEVQPIMPDTLVQDLEAINDDFVQEIQEEREKKILEEKKREEAEKKEEKEIENIELTPVVNTEKDNNDLANLNLDNLDDFLKKNSKNAENNADKLVDNSTNVIEEEMDSKKETIQEDNFDNFDEEYKNNSSIIKNIKLNEELWDELNLPDDLKNKIKIRVRMEIKTFLRDNLIPIMEKIIRRI